LLEVVLLLLTLRLVEEVLEDIEILTILKVQAEVVLLRVL
jgi:hypothetical protein